MMITNNSLYDIVICLVGILVILSLITIYIHFLENKRVSKIIEILVGIIEADNPNMEGHALHVHNLSIVIYEFMPFFYRLVVRDRELHYATLLLDIGKLAIPSQIIEKAGKFEKNDWEIIKKHPDLGADILSEIPGIGKAPEYVRYHHERIDGKGYHGLTGDRIPLGARIIAVADAYSAMTMNRSFKASMPYTDAIAELQRAAGTQLDADIVKIFCAIPKSRIDACMEDVQSRFHERSYI